MRGFILFVMLCLIFYTGCDKLKGDQGDRGSTGAQGQQGINGKDGVSALISSKIYTGTPTSSPFLVSCPEYKGTNNQILQVYLVSDTTMVELPFTTYSSMHYYLTSTYGGSVILSTIGLNSTPNPSTALYDTAWHQCSYRIEIKTFSTTTAATAYKKSIEHSNNTIEKLIGTDY